MLIENDPDQEFAYQGGESDSEDWRQEILRNAENHPGPDGTTTREDQLAESEWSDPEKIDPPTALGTKARAKPAVAPLPDSERLCCLKRSVTAIEKIDPRTALERS